ncbi:hypothetical protein HAX54_028714, partial [Datura stramonium]|nr:hypothetical protein [Datura stramonium]
MAYAQQMEDLKKRIRAERERNQYKRSRSAVYNDHNTSRNFLAGRSLWAVAPSTTSAEHLPYTVMIGE